MCDTAPCLLVRGFLETAQTKQVTVIALHCLLELNGKNLLLEIIHTLVTGYEEIKLVLIKRLPPRWLEFIVLENGMRVA